MIGFRHLRGHAAIDSGLPGYLVGQNQSQVGSPKGAGIFFFHYSSLCVLVIIGLLLRRSGLYQD